MIFILIEYNNLQCFRLKSDFVLLNLRYNRQNRPETRKVVNDNDQRDKILPAGTLCGEKWIG